MTLLDNIKSLKFSNIRDIDDVVHILATHHGVIETMVRTPSQSWGIYALERDLPNVSGSSTQTEYLSVGDRAYVSQYGMTYECKDATRGAARWVSAGPSDVGTTTVEIFVSAAGNDTTGTGSFTAPFASVGRAWAEVLKIYQPTPTFHSFTNVEYNHRYAFCINVIPPYDNKFDPNSAYDQVFRVPTMSEYSGSFGGGPPFIIQSYASAAAQCTVADPRFTTIVGPLKPLIAATDNGRLKYTFPAGSFPTTDADVGRTVRLFDSNNVERIRGQVAYQNGASTELLVFVGASGALRTSSAGTSWTSKTSGVAVQLNDVCCTGPVYVAVGASGTIIYSTDATTWSTATSNTALDLYSVTWNGSVFVAVGANGVVLTGTVTTPAGILTLTWQVRVAGSAGNMLSRVKWNAKLGMFIAGGYTASGALLRTSTDGITWSTAVTPFDATASAKYYGIDWNDTHVVVVGGGLSNKCIYSTDGVTWSQGADLNGSTNQALSLAWSHALNLWVAVGEGGIIRTIADPTSGTWTTKSSGVATALQRVCEGPGAILVAVGSSGVVLTSSDATTWTSQVSGIATDIFGVADRLPQLIIQHYDYYNYTFSTASGTDTVYIVKNAVKLKSNYGTGGYAFDADGATSSLYFIGLDIEGSILGSPNILGCYCTNPGTVIQVLNGPANTVPVTPGWYFPDMGWSAQEQVVATSWLTSIIADLYSRRAIFFGAGQTFVGAGVIKGFQYYAGHNCASLMWNGPVNRGLVQVEGGARVYAGGSGGLNPVFSDTTATYGLQVIGGIFAAATILVDVATTTSGVYVASSLRDADSGGILKILPLHQRSTTMSGKPLIVVEDAVVVLDATNSQVLGSSSTDITVGSSTSITYATLTSAGGIMDAARGACVRTNTGGASHITLGTPVVVGPFSSALAATQTATALACGAGSSSNVVGFVAPRPGSITAFVANLSAAITGSTVTATVSVYKNGVIVSATNLAFTSAGAATKLNVALNRGANTFVAGDVLTVKYTSNAITNTPVVCAFIEVTYS